MKNIEFIIPEGYELDEQNSTDKKVVYKPKEEPIKFGELVYGENYPFNGNMTKFLYIEGSVLNTPSLYMCNVSNGYQYRQVRPILTHNDRRATSEEIRIFKDIMSQNGWEYNEESRTLTKKRWRDKYCGVYYYITSKLTIAMNREECCATDDERYNAGNYFKTSEEAEKYRQKIIEILTNRE